MIALNSSNSYSSSSKESKYIQIYNELKSAITQKDIPANTRLLSKRKMAEQLGVSVNTVNTAYSQLLSEGFITVRPQSGYYVCPLDPLYTYDIPSAFTLKSKTPVAEIPPDDFIDFSIDGVDSSAFPYSVWRKLFKNIFNEYDSQLLHCSGSQGESSLRKAIAAYLYISRGVKCNFEQIIVGAGTENLLQILSFIIDDSSTIAMENPVYHKAYQFFSRTGHSVLPIDTDSHGVSPKPLKNLSSSVLYVTPSHQFPLGITMPINRRIQLLNWAGAEEERYIIEDDYDSEFRYGSKPIPALKSIDESGRVIYLGSFARTIAPALRISYMVLPENLLNKYHSASGLFSCAVSKLDQLVLTQFIEKGHYETHLNRMRKLYKEKRECFVSALQKSFSNSLEIGGENAGHHLILKVKNGSNELELCQQAQNEKVNVYPISPYFADKLPKIYESTILAGYATLSTKQISEGVLQLEKAWN